MEYCCTLVLHVQGRLGQAGGGGGQGETLMFFTSFEHQLSGNMSQFIPEVPGLSHNSHAKQANMAK